MSSLSLWSELWQLWGEAEQISQAADATAAAAEIASSGDLQSQSTWEEPAGEKQRHQNAFQQLRIIAPITKIMPAQGAVANSWFSSSEHL